MILADSMRESLPGRQDYDAGRLAHHSIVGLSLISMKYRLKHSFAHGDLICR